MANKVHRLNHVFREDKRTFIMAMDHGNGFNVLPAMKYPGKIISEVARAGADAFLATVGLAEKFADDFHGKGIILRLDGGSSFLGSKDKPLQAVVNVEDAIRLGADSVISMGFPGSKWEDQTLKNLSRNILDCNKWGIPLTAEMLPRGFEGGEDSRTPANITFVCRMGAEMGADIIKTEYTGDPESFKELCESVYVPVVILGGSKKVSEEKLLTEIKEALSAGGAGIAMGRNIWNHENPARYASAIARLIHEDCSVESALKELNKKF
ncbi:aldolase [Clostridium swellfunianum]|uniref:class I fructose-bisphosphate aldolase n=1 Tax=Clostridium swellfunianum TaxID=1367462 RepID=UPI00202E73FD|nr:aldolase [Clostridium swellfunianum]MCM0648108.1 aldolase [Clostridium swellfunianum]